MCVRILAASCVSIVLRKKWTAYAGLQKVVCLLILGNVLYRGFLRKPAKRPSRPRSVGPWDPARLGQKALGRKTPSATGAKPLFC